MQQCEDGKDQYFRVTEDLQQGSTELLEVCGLPESDPGAAAISQFHRSTVKVSAPSMAPHTNTYAQFPNLFWSDVKEYVEDTGISVADVRLKFIPVKYVWDFGDGKTMTTKDPGKAWDPALTKTTYDAEENYDRIHHYRKLGTFDVTLTVVFNGQYSVNGGEWVNIAGSVSNTSPPPIPLPLVIRLVSVGVGA